MNRPSALVLAAGTSSRFKGTKQLAEMGGKALVQRVVDAVPPDEVGETVVVVGHQAEAVAKTIGGRTRVRTVVNRDYDEGIASSMRVGVRALSKGATGVIVLLADEPFVTRPLLHRMLRVFSEGGTRGKIVAAAHGDLVAPPVIFAKRYFRELTGLRGDQGAKSVIGRHAASLRLVRLRSSTALTDIDTREEFGAAVRLFESREPRK